MAQRDPFFYYYPKGWDILYPAHFGFFPYRATKFRGSSSAICVSAFGIFLLLGGGLMLYLGYFFVKSPPILWTFDTGLGIHFSTNPIQLAAPLLLTSGLLLIFAALICSLSAHRLCGATNVRKHHEAPRVTILTRYFKEPSGVYEKSPYMPLPPPAYPVLENRYAQSAMYNPQSELKLYPPVLLIIFFSVPGRSTLSLHGREPSVYLANPYNTLRAVSVNKYYSTLDSNNSGSYTNATVPRERIRSGSVTTGRRRSSESSSHPIRSKSLAPPQKNERIRRGAVV
ncbi:unnamed protein product [Anisakis simplex]|uniref:Uncharacterized protein n=1 Tax=Anisakis simplex TaxID=6269 RepID=A0A0M3JV86_ANISI|nr:unnamed protein product [Anisakis simplex]